MKEEDSMDLNTFDHERGHSLVPEPEVLAQIPELYATDGQPLEEKTVYVHYFVGKCDWMLMELDQKEWLAFGWCDLGMGFPELGYFSLLELANLEAQGRMRFVEGDTVTREGTFPVYVERELEWTPRPFGER